MPLTGGETETRRAKATCSRLCKELNEKSRSGILTLAFYFHVGFPKGSAERETEVAGLLLGSSWGRGIGVELLCNLTPTCSHPIRVLLRNDMKPFDCF